MPLACGILVRCVANQSVRAVESGRKWPPAFVRAWAGKAVAELASSVLIEFAYPELPDALAEKARETLTAKVAQMLEEYGSCLSLDTLKLISDRLFKFGTSEDRAGEASRAALAVYLDDLSEALSAISFLDELDAFERELMRLVNNYGVSHTPENAKRGRPRHRNIIRHGSTKINRASQPFSLNPTGTLSRRPLAHFVSAIDNANEN